MIDIGIVHETPPHPCSFPSKLIKFALAIHSSRSCAGIVLSAPPHDIDTVECGSAASANIDGKAA